MSIDVAGAAAYASTMASPAQIEALGTVTMDYSSKSTISSWRGRATRAIRQAEFGMPDLERGQTRKQALLDLEQPPPYFVLYP